MSDLQDSAHQPELRSRQNHIPSRGEHIDEACWFAGARQNPTQHCDVRSTPDQIDLIVLHCVSLPEGQYGTGAPERLFVGQLDCQEHPSFADLEGLEVAPHIFIDRAGEVVQFVPFDMRAWHAGLSQWAYRTGCNDFSIGIELEGDVAHGYTKAQYNALHNVLVELCLRYPQLGPDRIVGHSDIATGRKDDPGPHFDWAGVLNGVNQAMRAVSDPGNAAAQTGGL